MSNAILNYALNLFSLLRGQRLLRPLVVTYYLTTRCNLNCAYCEDFGARRNGQALPPLALEEALRVLRVVRTATDRLILTGGEPLLHPEVDTLVARARSELGFQLTMLTNAALLHEHEAVLPHLKRLVISLDSLDLDLWRGIINVPPEVAAQIFDNIRAYAALQQKYGYHMILNCVLTPQTLPGARDLLEFCKQHAILVSFSPQAVQNWPHYDLLVAQAYKDFLRFLLDEKRRGAPIVGSAAYLRTLLEFKPYACYPTLAPRILPDGSLIYPCRPIERENNGHGGHASSLLSARNWGEAVAQALGEYGQPPLVCSSCFQQCYAEPSLMQAQPFDWLVEQIACPASRQADLPSFAPG